MAFCWNVQNLLHEKVRMSICDEDRHRVPLETSESVFVVRFREVLVTPSLAFIGGLSRLARQCQSSSGVGVKPCGGRFVE